MTEFVVREVLVTNVDKIVSPEPEIEFIDNQPFVMITIIAFDAFLGLFGLIGCLLDRSNKLVIAKKNISENDEEGNSHNFSDLHKLQDSTYQNQIV